MSKKITVLAGKRTYLIPVVMYLFATVLSALGPGTIPTTAIMMVFGMTLAVEMKINPAMLAAIIFLGAAGGGMSPLAATGIIGLNLCEEFGLTGIEAPLLVNGVFSSTVYAAVVYIAFGGDKLKSEKALRFYDHHAPRHLRNGRHGNDFQSECGTGQFYRGNGTFLLPRVR